MGVARTVARGITPMARRAAPKFTSGYVRALLERAIDGVGPVRPAAEVAENKLALAGGDVEDAVKALISQHVKLAGAQGFVTNVGGLATLAVTVPANITGVAILQCHLAAGIAHLRGYDLDDPRVRNAILACLLGEDSVKELIAKKKLPSSPMVLATSPVHDPELDDRIASAVTAELVGKVGGRRAATMVGRRIPLLGGGIGAASDAMSTHQIGAYVSSGCATGGQALIEPSPKSDICATSSLAVHVSRFLTILSLVANVELSDPAHLTRHRTDVHQMSRRRRPGVGIHEPAVRSVRSSWIRSKSREPMRKCQILRGTRLLRCRTGSAVPVIALFLSALLLSLASAARAATVPVPLGTAEPFVVLAGAGITNTGPTTLNGDIGTFPTPSITGKATLTVNGSIHAADAVARIAKDDLREAYNTAAGEQPPEPIAGDLGGQRLTSGVYKSASSIGLTGTLTLDAQGDPNSVFVFQAGTTLTTASASRVLLVNGAQACNVYWQIGSSATLGTNSTFIGTILALQRHHPHHGCDR
ncbi:MAG: ice-binding family protein [Nocardioidaceae bacterium]